MARELSQLTHRTDWHERLPRYAWASGLVGEGARVLDLGAGTGEGAALLAQADATSVTAVDASLAMVEEGERRFGDRKNLAFFARLVDQTLSLEPPSDADFDARETIVHGALSLDDVKAAQAALEGEFDLIVMLDHGLAQPDDKFLEAAKARLADGGVVVIAVRIDSARTMGDVLATISGQSEAVGPLGLSTTEAVEERFAAHFAHVRLIESRASLTTEIGGEGEMWIEAPDLRSHGALLVLASDETLPEVEGIVVEHALSALSESLGRNVERLQMRAINHEHRSLLYEEQLGQKDALIDDLEREVRATDKRRREVEVQLARLREELDGLQGELTQPQILPQSAELERREVESAAATLRETVDAQRMTIDALNTRLSLLQTSPLGDDEAAERARAATNERLVALENEIIARDADIVQLRREAEAAGVAEASSSAEAEAARAELERAAAASEALRQELESHREESRAARAELERRLADAIAGHEAAQKDVARLESELGDARDALRRTQSKVSSLEQSVSERTLEADRPAAERTQLEEPSARFQRGRRVERAGIPTTTSGMAAGESIASAQAAFGADDEDGEDLADLEARLRDAVAEIAMRDRRIVELEAKLGASTPSPAKIDLDESVPRAPTDAEPNFSFVDTRTNTPVPPDLAGGELVEVVDDADETDGVRAETGDSASPAHAGAESDDHDSEPSDGDDADSDAVSEVEGSGDDESRNEPEEGASADGASDEGAPGEDERENEADDGASDDEGSGDVESDDDGSEAVESDDVEADDADSAEAESDDAESEDAESDADADEKRGREREDDSDDSEGR